jgi:hypothetical protein
MPQDRERTNSSDSRTSKQPSMATERPATPAKGADESVTTGAYAHPDEAGAYIGRLPEREADTLPGRVRPDDERIAAYGSTSGKVERDDVTPAGHREGQSAGDDEVREAGQDR